MVFFLSNRIGWIDRVIEEGDISLGDLFHGHGAAISH